MGLLDRLRHRNETPFTNELKVAAGHASIMGSLGQSQGEQEWQEQLATNGLLVSDWALEKLLYKLVEQEETATGSLDMDNVTTLLFSSNKLRTSWLDLIDAEIYKERIHLIKLHMLMDREEAEGFDEEVRFLDAIELHAHINLDNSKDGRLAKLLKVQSRAIEVRMAELQKGKQQ